MDGALWADVCLAGEAVVGDLLLGMLFAVKFEVFLAWDGLASGGRLRGTQIFQWPADILRCHGVELSNRLLVELCLLRAHPTQIVLSPPMGTSLSRLSP